MSDLISRQAAIEYFMTNTNWHDEDGYEIHDAEDKRALLKSYFDGIPSAEPEPKVGKWCITDAYPHNVYCSVCHKRFAQTHWAVWEDGSLPRKFCPNCGAKMEEQDANGT